DSLCVDPMHLEDLFEPLHVVLGLTKMSLEALFQVGVCPFLEISGRAFLNGQFVLSTMVPGMRMVLLEIEGCGASSGTLHAEQFRPRTNQCARKPRIWSRK